MTAPVAHGYPDWVRQAPRADVIYLQDNTTLNALKIYPITFVGAMSHVGITFDNLSANYVQILFDWLADAAGTIPLHTEEVFVGPGGSYYVQVPVIGPFVRVSIVPGAFPNDIALKMYATSGSRLLNGLASAVPILISVDNQVVNAGATATFESLYTAPGVAHFQIFTDAVAWDGSITLMQSAVFGKRALTFTAAWGQRGEMIYLSAAPARVIFHNGDAALKHVWIHLIANSIGVA